MKVAFTENFTRSPIFGSAVTWLSMMSTGLRNHALPSSPAMKSDKPVTGLLYIPMEKQKMKDLELTYGGKENRITLRFKS